MKTIVCSAGLEALVDEEDFDELNVFKWHVLRTKNKTYARSQAGGVRFYMHQMLVAVPAGYEVDHINGNGLDNRRENLRGLTAAQNHINRQKHANNTTGHTGVYATRHGTWEARIRVEGKSRYLGAFKSPDGAANAYAEAASKYFGEYARKS